MPDLGRRFALPWNLVCASSALDSRGALLVPLRVGPLQQVFRAGGAQMRAPVLHHHLAIDVRRRIRDQEACEIGKLPMLAGAAERVARSPFVAALGTKLAGRTGGRERAGRD